MTIREIAKETGVSIATVSRALNNPEKVRPKTLKKVLEAAKEGGYEADIPYGAFGMPSDKVITCITGEMDTPFLKAIIVSLSKTAAQHGYFVSVHITLEDAYEQQIFNTYSKSGCAGIVLDGYSRIKDIDSDVPVCLIDDTTRVAGNFHCVTSDNEAAVKLLLDHLLKLGHTKIGFISGKAGTAAGNTRTAIFKAQMKERSLDLPESFIFEGDYLLQSGVAAFDYFYSLPDMPTAIIASNDEMAKGFIIRAHSLGVRVPEDISICGVDALPGDIFLPKITSVAQNTELIGEEIFKYIAEGCKEKGITKKVIPVLFSPGDTTYKL